MTGINHAITGALVAVAVKQPALALPMAFLSHFVIDAIPHYDHKDLLGRRRLYKIVLVLDAILSLGLLVVLVMILKQPPWIIISCGLLGILPDAMWLPTILQGRLPRINKATLLGQLRQFHKTIQWSEGRRGLYVEIMWFMAMLILVLYIG
ncbi:hypothetical protein HYW35_01970 [Candidatus Saccharibacteria bacterium]|nr:hypothetical protein [Candidatus Saccharibacteria bacterium]